MEELNVKLYRLVDEEEALKVTNSKVMDFITNFPGISRQSVDVVLSYLLTHEEPICTWWSEVYDATIEILISWLATHDWWNPKTRRLILEDVEKIRKEAEEVWNV